MKKLYALKKLFQAFVGSYYYIVTAALIVFISYIFGADLLAYYLLILFAITIVITCEDLLPLLTTVFFIPFIPNPKSGTNGIGSSKFYSNPVNYIQLFVLAGILAVCLIARIIIKKEYKALAKQSALTAGFYVLIAAAVLNGLFSKYFKPLNLLLGLSVGAVIFIPYLMATANFKHERKRPLDYVAVLFTCIGTLVALQLLHLYLTKPIILKSMVKGDLTIGWGISNTIGYVLLFCLPYPFYLARKAKPVLCCAFLTLFLAFLTAILFTFSRASLLFAAPVFAACLVLGVVKSASRFTLITYWSLAITIISILLALYYQEFSETFHINLNSGWDDSGRYDLWKIGYELFKEFPVFGTGINLKYPLSGSMLYEVGYHNTVLHILYCYGIFGLLAYLFHRYQSIRLLIKKPTVDRLVFAAGFLGFLGGALLDISMANFFMLTMYSFVLGMFESDLKLDRSKTSNINTVISI